MKKQEDSKRAEGSIFQRLTESSVGLFYVLHWTVLLLLFSSLLLAAFHHFTHPFIIATFFSALLLAILVGVKTYSPANRSPVLIAAAFTIGILVVSVVCIMPLRGEWIAGGWDPGVYSNLGIRTARIGSFDGPPGESALALLRTTERTPFVRRWGSYVEAFPGCPIDSEGSIRGSFFRTFPTWIGLLHHLGGYRASTRANDIAGLLSLTALFLMLRDTFPKSFLPVFASILMGLNSIWLYHLHTPLPEMLQIFFVLSFLAFHLHDGKHISSVFGATLCLFLAVTNRGSFFAFGSAAVLVSAWQDKANPDRTRSFKKRILFMLAVTAGMMFNQVQSGDYLARLQHIQPFIIKTGMMLMGVILLFETGSFFPPFQKWMAGIREILIYRLLALLIGTALIVFLFIRPEALANAKTILSFTGYPLMLLAVGGLIALCLSPAKEQRWLFPWVLFFFAATTLMIIEKHVAHLFPWATRRYVVYTVPLIALAGAVFLQHIWKQRRPIRYLTLVLIMISAFSGLEQRYRAWRYTEYNGLQKTLHTIAEQIPPNTVVLADHFVWGTPLNFLYGIPVLNGAGLLNNQTECQQALHAIRVIEKSGRTVQLLTSTDKRASIFACDMGFTNLLWASAPYEYETIVHSPRADEFLLKKQTVTFHLYSQTHDQ